MMWIIRIISRCYKLLWRWRRVTLPLSIAIALAIGAAQWHQFNSSSWPFAFVISIIGVSSAILGPRLSDFWSKVVSALVPDAFDSGRKGVLDRNPERIYLALLTFCVGTWLALCAHYGFIPLIRNVWIVLTIGLGGSWWSHRRIRGTHRNDRYTRRWRILADHKKSPIKELHGSRITHVETGRTQTLLNVRLAAGMTATKVALRREELASFFSLRLAAIHIIPTKNNARRMQVRIIPRDPWQQNIPHPMPSPGSVSIRQNSGRFPMGIYADGNEAIYTLQHTLIVGQTGSGKSVWLESLLVWLTACDDCVIVAGDLAAGATLRIWESILARPLADDYDSVVELLQAVMAVIEDRERRLGIAKATNDSAPDSVPPGPGTPWLVLIIDEYPDFVAEARSRGPEGTVDLALLGRIAKRIRKTGGRIILLAQNGSKDDVGSKELQGQLRSTVGMALNPHASRTLWGPLRKSGFDSVDLGTGQYLLHDEWHSGPQVAKGFFVSVRDRRDHIRACISRPVLESSAWNALRGNSDVINSRPQFMKDDSLEAIWKSLAHSPARAEDLAQRLSLSRATTFRKLRLLAKMQRAYSRAGIWYANIDA